MKNIKNFIFEKLKINSKTKIINNITINDLKRGDIIVYKSKMFDNYKIGIFYKYTKNNGIVQFLASYDYETKKFHTLVSTWDDRLEKLKYASQEEIDELMEIIDKNGYRYNVKGKNNIEIVKK